MNKFWSKSITLLIIVNLVFSPVAFAAEENMGFFASIGSLIRQDIIFSRLFGYLAIDSKDNPALPTVGGIALLASYIPGLSYTPLSEDYRFYTVTVTAYSSSVDETDSTPFITASGKRTQDGVVAANFLPFGTKVKIPELFGNKTFVVEDRMNRRFSNRMDIWFPSKWQAKRFGKRTAQIVVFNEG